MVKSKEDLIQYLQGIFNNLVLDKKKCNEVYNYAHKEFDIPRSVIADCVSKRTDLNSVTIFVLFIILESLNKTKTKDEKIDGVDKYFAMQEVKNFRTTKYDSNKIKFPLIFKMIQIADDQWIGHIDAKTLMQLRQAQLINYNTNTQRTMQRIIHGDQEDWKIALNNKAVEEIKESFAKNEFIPNAITLNIPLDSAADFYYDNEKCELVIDSLDSFDILDGFHRYIGLGRTADFNPEFNYNMELRIVNWDETRAKTFIWQEDKKTFMRKLDRESMNMNKLCNVVATRINDNVQCNFKGLISRNEGIIPFAEFSEMIDYFYFKKVKKSQERIAVVQSVKEITNNLNLLSEYDISYLERKMDYRTLLTIMFCFDYFKEADTDVNVCEIIDKFIPIVKASGDKKFNNKTPRKSLMNLMEVLLVENNMGKDE